MQTSLYANRLEVAKSVSLGQNVIIHGVLHYLSRYVLCDLALCVGFYCADMPDGSVHFRRS